MADLSGKKVAIVATDYFETSELFGPLKALSEAGAAVEVIAPHEGTIQGLQHVEPGESATVDKMLSEADPASYDAVVLPGGVVNADHLRLEEKAQEFVLTIFKGGKPVAAICHAPWLLVSAGIVTGKKLTSYPSLQDDIRNAGGSWINEEVVVDDNLITSRKPDDLPAFNKALLDALKAQ